MGLNCVLICLCALVGVDLCRCPSPVFRDPGLIGRGSASGLQALDHFPFCLVQWCVNRFAQGQ